MGDCRLLLRQPGHIAAISHAVLRIQNVVPVRRYVGQFCCAYVYMNGRQLARCYVIKTYEKAEAAVVN
jgi:hypothetical protein